jgi:hypothetical protein
LPSSLHNSSEMASLHNLQFSGKYLHAKCITLYATTRWRPAFQMMN